MAGISGVQLLVGKTTQAAAAAPMITNAQATALQAQLAAYASTAAIPIVGPAMAPAALTAAIGVTEPLVAAISGLALQAWRTMVSIKFRKRAPGC
jgi:hypothetical protein